MMTDLTSVPCAVRSLCAVCSPVVGIERQCVDQEKATFSSSWSQSRGLNSTVAAMETVLQGRAEMHGHVSA